MSGYPDVLPGYMGPRDLLERYQRGEIVTSTDALMDQSEWIVVGEDVLDNRSRARLKWMTENLERVNGEVRRRIDSSAMAAQDQCEG